MSGQPIAIPLPEFPRAACRGLPVEVFIGNYGSEAQVKDAMKVCRRCPERVDCREFAITHSQMIGVWGGTTTGERETIRERRARGGN